MTSAHPPREHPDAPVSVLTGNPLSLVPVDIIFGAYNVLVIGLALLALARGEGSVAGVLVLCLYLFANGALSAVSRAIHERGGLHQALAVEWVRAATGLLIAPLAYVFTTGALGGWWPAFLIMCLGGNIVLGLMTASPRPGRALVLYYVALMFLSELFVPTLRNWSVWLVDAGTVAIVGLLFAQIVAQLGQALVAEREQGTALAEVNQHLQAAKDAAEAALAESRRLTAIIENTTDYVGIADVTGKVTYMNRAGRRMIGWGEHESLEGLSFAELFTPEGFVQVQTEGIPTALREGTWAAETSFQHRDGHAIPIWVVGSAHRGPDGVPYAFSGTGRDISESKRVQAELQAAKDAAESANRAKSTFLANMSHEIRTPMNAVIGMTGLLLNTTLTPKQRDFVETIRTSGDALLAVLNDILDFSKIEAGHLDLESQPFELRTCIEAAFDLFAPRAAEKGLDLAYLVDPETPAAIVGDVTRLRQVLVNLVGNAVKFTERGEVVVTVAPAPDAGPDGLLRLRFAVKDTGTGIPAEKQDRLFQSFSQVDASTTRVYGGTGLGLAISRRLVELMGGVMGVESDGISGHGATFHFTIAVRPALDYTPLRTHLYTAQPSLSGKRLLVVDDNPTNRRILSLQAQTWGMYTREAPSAAEALALLRAGGDYDLVLLDMQMPEMDGLALATAIRALDERAGLPLVMLTSVGYDARTHEEGQFAAFLTKPVKPSQLYDVLVEVLHTSAPGERLAAARPMAPADLRSPSLLGGAAQFPLRILLAEDVAVNQKFALLALEDMGYTADVAANGNEVLLALRRQPYDVILMDVQMPELDGLEATRRVRREWPAAAQPYIIAMTANALQGDREMCLQAGMDDYISKPVYLEELRAVLARAGAQRAPQAQGAVAGSASSPAAVAQPAVAEAVRPALDPAVLAKLRGRASGRTIFSTFLDEAPRTVAALRAAVAQGDAVGLREAAHSLKGSSRYLGAADVAERCAALEQLGREGTTSGAPEQLPALEAALEAVYAALRAALEG